MLTTANVSDMGSSRFVISLDHPPGLRIMFVSENENLRFGISPLSVAGGTNISGFLYRDSGFSDQDQVHHSHLTVSVPALWSFSIGQVFPAIFPVIFYP